VISAGDIPVKFIGYSLASIVVPILGTATQSFICRIYFYAFFTSFYQDDKQNLLSSAKPEHYKDFNKQTFAKNTLNHILKISLATNLLKELQSLLFFSEYAGL